MALKLPTSLKLTQLRSIAQKCGVSSSGTKPVLSSRLIDEINRPGSFSSPSLSKKRSIRVLSIDMGIRNLAYCVLEYHVDALPTTSVSAISLESSVIPKTTGIIYADRASSNSLAQPPKLLAWRRLDISRSADCQSAAAPHHRERESFHPSALAAQAHRLLRTQLLPLAPTYILIEHQRFRSNSSPTIFEWTLRVNMLESILYATLETLRAEKIWAGEVHGVEPARVQAFWVGDQVAQGDAAADGDGEAPGNEALPVKQKGGRPGMAQTAKVKNKNAKIDVAGKWLNDGKVVELVGESVHNTALAYLQKWGRKLGAKKALDSKKIKGKTTYEPRTVDATGGGALDLGKIDDLADCLLQGMAWIEWEENKKRIRQCGTEGFLK